MAEYVVVVEMTNRAEPFRVAYTDQSRACRALNGLKKAFEKGKKGKQTHTLMATTIDINRRHYSLSYIERDGQVI